ncbi:MAG: hypothetical protein U9Q70_07550 [Chloroflexota bacterium]|nr:hypothetical protein [Chloroflexota bacterium]
MTVSSCYDDEDDLGSEMISTTVVHYDGTRWPRPCVIGQPSCYSGHNGIDYDMHYERVLALVIL